MLVYNRTWFKPVIMFIVFFLGLEMYYTETGSDSD